MFSRLSNRLFYGWVTVISLLLIGVMLYGIPLSFGVFFKSIESEFNLSRTLTSGLVSASMVFLGIFAILGGWAIDKYGPRIVFSLMGLFTGLSLLLTSQTNAAWQLYISYSLLLSIGTGAIFVAITSTVSRWFDKKRGLALGISGAGEGMGLVLIAPFATYLIYIVDWRMAYIVIGLITLIIVIPLSMLLKNNPKDIGALPDGEKLYAEDSQNEKSNRQKTKFSLMKIVKTRSFWLIMFIYLFFAFCLFFVFTHLVPHITDIGITPARAASVISLMGVAGTAGRVIMGAISDRIGRKLTSILCLLLQAAAMLWLIWSSELWMLYLFALVFGYAYGGFGSCIGALISGTFELSNIGTIFGVLDIGFAIGGAIGPAVGGYIFDVTNSYTMAFLICAVAIVVATVLIIPIRPEMHTSKLTIN